MCSGRNSYFKSGDSDGGSLCPYQTGESGAFQAEEAGLE